MNDWIMIEDNLPEQEDTYLILWKLDNNKSFYALCEYTFDEGFILERLPVYPMYKDHEIEVVAWMELPAKPE